MVLRAIAAAAAIIALASCTRVYDSSPVHSGEDPALQITADGILDDVSALSADDMEGRRALRLCNGVFDLAGLLDFGDQSKNRDIILVSLEKVCLRSYSVFID